MIDIGWVGVDLESLVDDRVWCVDVDLSCFDPCPSRACGRVSCLRTHLAYWTVHVGMHKLGVVLVHDFLVNQS